MHHKTALKVSLSFLVALFAYIAPFGLLGNAHTMLFVLVFVAMLWITEAVPLHATAIFAAFLIITLIGLEPREVFTQYFDPVIVLLLGGFVISIAMSRHKLDEYIAHNIISRAGDKPKIIILALIVTSTFISMWISNSATAAIVMPIALVILAKNKLRSGVSNFGKAAVLAVGYGATIGGIGTVIGSTPNLIAAKFLHDNGTSFTFFDWFYRGFPFMVILMLVGWIVLINLYKPEKGNIKIVKKSGSMTYEQKMVLAIFSLTIFLWITENIHGVSSAVVALVPVILFYFSGLLKTDDFMRIDWPTLILVGGGFVIGLGVHATSLDASIASVLSNITGGHGVISLFLILGIFGIILTTIISNTTAAAVYLPIVVAMASGFGVDTTNTVVVAAIGVSLDFIFPFGTPPTAIAYGTRFVNQKDIAKAGIIISLFGAILLALMALLW